MRIALFGGSFDPPHTGHLRIALAAQERLHLDQVLLAPAGRQPLKSHHPASFPDRLAMVRLLATHHPALRASDVDGPQPGFEDQPSYTVDALARLRPTLPPDTTLFFLAGADSFLTLRKWYRAAALLEPAMHGGLLDGWILAARPGFPLDSLDSALPAGYSVPACTAEAGPVLTQTLLDPSGSPATPLHILPDLDEPSTATSIRDALAAGQEPLHLGPQISAYIRRHRLYPEEGCMVT